MFSKGIENKHIAPSQNYKIPHSSEDPSEPASVSAQRAASLAHYFADVRDGEIIFTLGSNLRVSMELLERYAPILPYDWENGAYIFQTAESTKTFGVFLSGIYHNSNHKLCQECITVSTPLQFSDAEHDVALYFMRGHIEEDTFSLIRFGIKAGNVTPMVGGIFDIQTDRILYDKDLIDFMRMSCEDSTFLQKFKNSRYDNTIILSRFRQNLPLE
jgi:hypothetical protein